MALRDPANGSPLCRREPDVLVFEGGRAYPVKDGTPVLIDEHSSLFTISGVLLGVETTQSESYSSPGRAKNFIRQRLLPSLSADTSLQGRYGRLAKLLPEGPILVIGAGDKSDNYRRSFPDREVVTSDVHSSFGVDLVFDAHSIPFCDGFFSLTLAPQVLEHTVRPWIVAAELQRVTKKGGYIQIEVPFAFPYHGVPYDFFRFTPAALRFLFPRCSIDKLESPEGLWSGAAVALSNALVDTFACRYARWLALAASRLALWWLKYVDRVSRANAISMPKGFAVRYRVDGEQRADRELLEDVKRLSCLRDG